MGWVTQHFSQKYTGLPFTTPEPNGIWHLGQMSTRSWSIESDTSEPAPSWEDWEGGKSGFMIVMAFLVVLFLNTR